MDMMTIIGVAAVFATLFFVLAADNILSMMFNPMAALLVFGGTFSATLIAYSWEIIKEILPSLKLLIFSGKNSERDRHEMVEVVTGLAEKSRRQGLQSLQEDVSRQDNKFLVYGLQMIIDGLEYDMVKDNLEKEIQYSKEHHQQVSGVFKTMATLAPIFGLLGTLTGVVQMLQNLSNPANMGVAMAHAVTATFYGILLANICIPIGIKLTTHSERDLVVKELIKEGLLSIHQGDIPLIVRKKLNSFLISKAQVGGK